MDNPGFTLFIPLFTMFFTILHNFMTGEFNEYMKNSENNKYESDVVVTCDVL